MDRIREEFSELVENIGGNVEDRDIDYHTDEFEDIHVDYLWLMFKREIDAAKASPWISVESGELPKECSLVITIESYRKGSIPAVDEISGCWFKYGHFYNDDPDGDYPYPLKTVTHWQYFEGPTE